MNKNVIEISADNFLPTITQDKLTLVDFWAEWCGPCKMLLPTIDALADEYAGVVNVCKLNVDSCEDLAAQYGIQSVPTILFFKNGTVVEKVGGARPKPALVAIIEAKK